MLGSVLVDVAIGVVLLYLIVALFCTAIQEWIAQIFDLRAKHLKAAINILISGTEQPNADARAVLDHPIVKMLGVDPRKNGPGAPSYISARNFAEALVAHLVPPAGNQQLDLAKLKAGVEKIQNPDAKRALQAVIERAEAMTAQTGEQLRAAVRGIEVWYDGAMDHASGWYKRRIRWFLLAIAAVLAVVVNADSVQVGLRLANDEQLRANVAALAARTAPPDANEAETLKALQADVAKKLQERNATGAFGALPIGWGPPCEGLLRFGKCYGDGVNAGAAFFLKLLGLGLTTIAAALGAPFWFGLLQQLNAARSAGPKPVSATAPDRD